MGWGEGEGRRLSKNFLGSVCNFNRKGFFGANEKCQDFFRLRKKSTGFLGVLYIFLSAQINNNKGGNLLLGWDFLRYAKK